MKHKNWVRADKIAFFSWAVSLCLLAAGNDQPGAVTEALVLTTSLAAMVTSLGAHSSEHGDAQ